MFQRRTSHTAARAQALPLLLSAALAALGACSSDTFDDDDHCIEVGENLPDRNWIAISAGSFFACGLMADGEVECWGTDFSGETEAPEGPFEAVSAGHGHACGLRDDGSVDCWGGADAGQCDVPSGTYTQVVAASNHSCALTVEGEIVCWGCGEGHDQGQCASRTGPYAEVTAGAFHTCGLRTDGSIECWGSNEGGQGDVPEGVYTRVTAGMHGYTCALDTDGHAHCWGLQDYTSIERFFDLDAGWEWTCGLQLEEDEGHQWCWGNPNLNLLQEGPYSQISVGYKHACAVRNDGSARCWGDCDFNTVCLVPGG